MLVKLVCEGEHTVVQNKFQERNNFVFGNVMGMFQKAFGPYYVMFVVSFLLITSRSTGTGMLEISALTSKETMVSSELMVFP